MTDRELLEQIAQKVSNIELQQSEHSEILQALNHAKGSEKAQIDQLTHAVARIECRQTETDKKIERMAGDITFLVRKSAEHDDDIRELRRAK